MAQDPNAEKEVPKNILEMINKIPLEDEDENALKVSSIRYLEDDRIKIYGVLNESILKGEHVLAVECLPKDADEAKQKDDDDDTTLQEKVIVISNNEVDIIELEDKITMEDLSPSKLIEYTFYENGPWFLAPMSQLSLEGYRKMKFKAWKEMIENPTCEAAFKRLLKIGLITNMFDNVAFPSPENEKADWIVKDDHGKDVTIPRPVKKLRAWNCNKRCYKDVQAHLDGAPKPEDAEKYWNDMLNKFKDERGDEYINNLVGDGLKK
eukprot:CAMPEP_0201583864 /NCGR_PEP_ID=MMETSP0190_2-20130828/103694_1 /ASSEMBLY_ACC=CAM_ASM_000263 /TAXON_ID=37353 /ORGANISM="Rosalina sp." /LENGTH=264 /DNA_ID=CAMNT_0048026643 /DNA_START=18 /DNA_END=812 /DNA_ORIENTATION=+